MIENYGDQFRWFIGVVTQNVDPMQLGRVQVRIFGVHSDVEENLPNAQLPWATVMAPTTEGGTSGVGKMPQLLPGSHVVGFFMDGNLSQIPLILGTIPHIEIPSPMQVTKAKYAGVGYGFGQVDPSLARAAGLDRQTTSNTPQYPNNVSVAFIEQNIRAEARLRGIDEDVAVKAWKSEGYASYQSKIPRTGTGSYQGYEASFGPYQLFTGGGLGNDYESLTGRSLANDNTPEGVVKQIQFSLDQAIQKGWTPWYGPAKVGISSREGLSGATVKNNWR